MRMLDKEKTKESLKKFKKYMNSLHSKSSLYQHDFYKHVRHYLKKQELQDTLIENESGLKDIGYTLEALKE